MPYRVPEPRETPEPPAPAREPGYRCTRCGAAFDASESEPRCPSCLRRSAVVAAGASARTADLPLPDGSRAPTLVAESRLWPLGSDCPLCAARAVDDSLFAKPHAGAKVVEMESFVRDR